MQHSKYTKFCVSIIYQITILCDINNDGSFQCFEKTLWEICSWWCLIPECTTFWYGKLYHTKLYSMKIVHDLSITSRRKWSTPRISYLLSLYGILTDLSGREMSDTHSTNCLSFVEDFHVTDIKTAKNPNNFHLSNLSCGGACESTLQCRMSEP